MKKLSFLLAVAIIATGFISSCKKDDSQKYVNFVSGQLTGVDHDMVLKSAPADAHRLWYVKKLTSDTWVDVDGTEFMAGTLASNYWASLARPINLPYTSPLALAYTPELPLKVYYKTVTADLSKVLYLAVHNFTPTLGYSIQMTGRELRDVLNVDLSQLKVDGYKFTVTVSYNLQTIDVDATALACDNTDNGYPTYVYSASVLHSIVFIVDKDGSICTQDNVAMNTGATSSLFDDYGKKVTDLTVGWVIEQRAPNGSGYVPYKTQAPNAITDNDPGKGLNLIFGTALTGNVNGTVHGTDVDMVVYDRDINVDIASPTPPTVATGFNASAVLKGEALWRNFKTSGTGWELAVGLPSAIGTYNPGSSNLDFTYDGQYYFYPDVNKNKFTFTYGAGIQTVNAVVADGKSFTSTQNNGTLGVINYMQITVAGRSPSSTVKFTNVILTVGANSYTIGDFVSSAWSDWKIENFDLSGGFSITGDVELIGQSTSSENNKIIIGVGSM